MDYQADIGLEVHVQLRTLTKIFCGCSTAFGAPPNTQTCPVCLGLPGTLPVLNRRAVDFALTLILAVDGEVNPVSILARKNYFYPDLPKGYQISQFERPLGSGGRLRARGADRDPTLEFVRIHLEEDAGKSLHAEGCSLVDLNRCGVPLIEIVTRPDLHTPEEAARFLLTLRQLVRYLGICDGNMEEGSLRCDANVSIRPRGHRSLGVKTELKNMNSFKAVERALRFEIDRQINLVEHGRPVVHETLAWDMETSRAQVLRSKEESLDYRYFPEPDLVPLHVSPEWLERIRAGLPELPAARRERLQRQYGLPAYDADVLTAERELADYFEAAAAAFPAAKEISNWVMGEVLRHLRERGCGIESYRVPPDDLADLLREVQRGTVSGKAAKDVLAHMAEEGGRPSEVIARLGLTQISDESDLAAVVDRVLAREASQVQAYRAGKTKVFGYLVGQVMREAKGQANPRVVNDLLRSRLARG